jgi:oxygen-dependent protoporphyrinogen oxidase
MDHAPAGPGTPDAVVVGGGVAGLVAARDLAVAGLRVLVLDAAATPGGAVGRHTVAGLDLDAGAESFATRGGTVAALAGELGLGDAVTAPAPLGAWVQLPSGPGTLPRAGLLGVPVDPWDADVRRTIGLVGALRASLDRLLPRGAGVGPTTTFGSLVRTRMGPRVLDRLVAPVVGGVHAADPADLDVRAVAPGLLPALAERGSLAAAVASLRALAPAGAAVGGLVGGMHTLPAALVEDLTRRGGTVEPATVARSVARTGDAWSVRVAGPDGDRTLTTPRLVLATPAPVTLDLLTAVLPRLAGVRTDPGADVVLATLVVDAPALDRAPRGTGVLVAPSAQGGPDGPRAKALTHATVKWPWLAEVAGPGRHVLRLSYGRAGGAGPDPGPLADVGGLTDERLTALALADASMLLGVPLTAGQVAGSARVRWSQSLPRASAAHREAVDAVRSEVAALPGVEVCGAWVAGNGLAAVVPHARAAARRLAPSTGGTDAAAG